MLPAIRQVVRRDLVMRVEPQQLEKAMFLGMGVERFTQDSPILPDVWAEYGQKPKDRVDLLLNPYNDESPGKLCEVLLWRLKKMESSPDRYLVLPDPNVPGGKVRGAAVNQSTVVLRLYFDELVCVVLPMTRWWNEYVWKDNDKKDADRKINRFLQDKNAQEEMINFMRRYPLERDESSAAQPDDQKASKRPEFTSEMLWLVRVVGAIALAAKGGPADAQRDKAETFLIDGHEQEVVDAAVKLLRGFRTVVSDDLKAVEAEPTGPRRSSDKVLDADARSFIWSASLNRQAKTAMDVSTTTVKADAARLLFDISCRHLTWAIIDSGVDASHPALQRRPTPTPLKASSKSKAAAPAVASPAGASANVEEEARRPWTETTRVIATYDFTIIRRLLNREEDEVWTEQLPQELRDYFEQNEPKTKEFRTRLKQGRSIDWDFLLPYLAIPYIEKPKSNPAAATPTKEVTPNPGEESEGVKTDGIGGEASAAPAEQPAALPKADEGDKPLVKYYEVPKYSHGTHVAGILAADWRKDETDGYLKKDLKGVCPDIQLYDLRVLGAEGTGDEFSLIAAMQFVRHLNAHNEKRTIHGVNLSISIKHNVKNYACGCTPVCEESERLVNAGLVVVAAAGNDGYLHYLTRGNKDFEGYSSISITDPGNSEAVITVGSTHREKAHAYGVSFFSSRGPTGDGRAKPDLVAPGEKIVSLIPGGLKDTMDGTSMAAPHVSGAAALLLARYPELIGRPTRVKEILCSTATDLGRERYFQGRGMVDILRAMQSL
jgi:subtilisin family serine protease